MSGATWRNWMNNVIKNIMVGKRESNPKAQAPIWDGVLCVATLFVGAERSRRSTGVTSAVVRRHVGLVSEAKKRFLSSVTVVRQTFLSKRKLLHAFADTSVGSRCSEDGYSPESWPETFRFRFASCIPGPMKFGSALCWMSDISTSEAGTPCSGRVFACRRDVRVCAWKCSELTTPSVLHSVIIQGHRFFAITWIDSLLLSFLCDLLKSKCFRSRCEVPKWIFHVTCACFFFSKYFSPLYSKSSFVVLGFCRRPYQCGTSRYLWQTIELLHGDKEMWIWKFERVFVTFEHGVEVREEAVDIDKRLSSKFSSTCQ